jgi:hypothetical protein
MRGQASAADGFNIALEKARHDLVVFVQQDIYLPRGWDSRFLEQFRAAEGRLGSVGVAGVFGYTFGPEGKTNLGRVLDRQMLLSVTGPRVNEEFGSDVLVLRCWLGVTDRAGGQDGAPAAQRGRTTLTPARSAAGSGNEGKEQLASCHGHHRARLGLPLVGDRRARASSLISVLGPGPAT